jgi:hypothetical protein
MYYGHSSWIGLVVLGAVFATRYFGAQRHRGHHRGSPSGSLFTGQAPPGAAGAGGTAVTGTDRGWFRDPFVRHEQRFWSGTEWTDHVTDGGVPGLDPPGPRRPGDVD